MRDWLEGFRTSSDSSSWVRSATQGSGNNYAQSIRVGGGAVGVQQKMWSVEPHCAVCVAVKWYLRWPFIHCDKEPVWNMDRKRGGGQETKQEALLFVSLLREAHRINKLCWKLPEKRCQAPDLQPRLRPNCSSACCIMAAIGAAVEWFMAANEAAPSTLLCLGGVEGGSGGGAARPKCSLTSLEKIWFGKNSFFLARWN